MQLLPAAFTSPSPTFLGLQSADCVYHRGVEDLFNGRGLGHRQRWFSSARRLRRRPHTTGNRSLAFDRFLCGSTLQVEAAMMHRCMLQRPVCLLLIRQLQLIGPLPLLHL